MSCGGGAGGGSSSANPTYTLSGTVTGIVQQGVTITLSGAGTGTAITSAGGAYSFAGLSNGYYTVTASLTNYAFTPSSRAAAINYGNAVAADFVSVDAYSISGTVTVTGSSSEGVTMTLTGSTLSAPVTTTTDSVGNYSFYRIVSSGTYTLTSTQSSTRTVCSGGLNISPGFQVTETTTFSPTQQSIAINNADVTGVNYNGTFARWSGACPN
jgi:hypothetical protein